ncbi:MAG: HD domain-containing protein [Pseudomonadota bacterium]
MLKQWTAIEKKIFDLAKPYLLVMNNELHTKEVVRFCLELLETEGGDRHIVIPAAILHDIGWSQLPEKQSIMMRIMKGDPEKIKIHEEIGARLAEGILSRVFYDKTQLDEVVAIIDGHDTRNHAVSLNDKIVKDADKLSRYSRKFCHIWPRWGTGAAPHHHFSEMEKGVKAWFFLGASKKIAEKEFYERVLEIQIQNCRVPAIAN